MKIPKHPWLNGRDIGICLCLGMLVLIVFGRAIGFGYVNYDDGDCVYANTVVSGGLSAASFKWALTHNQVGIWVPLTTLSHMLDCQVFGLKPAGHHLVNVLLHMLAVVLLFLALQAMSKNTWRSAFVAAIFAVHPLRVESVAWISERKDVLSAVFFMLTLLAYCNYVRRPGSVLRYGLLLVVFSLGLMSKPMLVTLPCVLLLLDFWPLKRLETGSAIRRAILEKAPLLFLVAIISYVQLVTDQEKLIGFEHISFSKRVANALVSYAVYLKQMLWPVDLAVFYPYHRSGFPLYEIAISAALCIFVTGGAIYLRKSKPWIIVGWLWFLGMLVPVIGLVQSGELAHADRYTYLPGIGVCVAGTWAVVDWTSRWRYQRVLLSTAALAAILIFCRMTILQMSYWHDSITLWTHTLRCTTDNTIANNNFGIALMRQGKTDEAISAFREAIRINPIYADAHYNLAKALVSQGRLEEGIGQYRELFKIAPDDAYAHNNLGLVLQQQGHVKDALSEYYESLRIDPNNAEAHNNLGIVFINQNQIEKGIAEFREAIRINPLNPEAHDNLGFILLQKGQRKEAIEEFCETLRLDPQNEKASNNLNKALSIKPH